MKRTSIVGPLLLIGIGGLFLARNLIPNLPLLDYLARYWPYLLIIWGGLRLLEILYWAVIGRPLPAAGVSGTEWLLVVFLCIFGSGLYTVRGYARDWWPGGRISIGGVDMFGESFEYPVAAEKAAGKAPRVVIESFRGNARITGADGEQMKVTGRKTIRSLDQGGADRANNETPFELVADGGQMIVRGNQERLSGNQRITHDLELTVPKGASIDARGRFGDFDITDINGSVDLNSDNAGVRLQNIGGEVRVDLRRSDIVRAVNVKGAVELKGRGNDIEFQNIEGPVTVNGTYTGVVQFRNLAKPLRFTGPQTELNIERLPGQVRMALGAFSASDLVGPIRLSSRSRDVQISDFTQSLEISIERGDIELRPGKTPLAKMDLRARSGDIELALPPAAKFELKATTSRGDVTNDYGAPLKAEPEGRGASLRGSVGGGGPTVTLQTDRGQITVRKSTAGEKTFPRTPDAPEAPKPLKPIPQ